MSLWLCFFEEDYSKWKILICMAGMLVNVWQSFSKSFLKTYLVWNGKCTKLLETLAFLFWQLFTFLYWNLQWHGVLYSLSTKRRTIVVCYNFHGKSCMVVRWGVLGDVYKIIFTLCENLILNLFSFSSARFSPDDKYSRHRVTLKRRFGILPTQQAKPVYWDTKKFCLTQDLYSELAWIGHLLFITFNLSCLVERDFWEFKCEGFVSISFMYGVTSWVLKLFQLLLSSISSVKSLF